MNNIFGKSWYQTDKVTIEVDPKELNKKIIKKIIHVIIHEKFKSIAAKSTLFSPRSSPF